MKSLEERLLAKVSPEPNSGCWLWTSCLYWDGYGRMRGPDVDGRAHRISYELFKGPIPDGLLVCHKCDVRSCVNPDHLFVGTQKENLRDMSRKGRSSYAGAKLTREQVAEIRARLSTGKATQRSIAQDFHVRDSQISRIKHGVRWAVPGKPLQRSIAGIV